MLVWQFPKNWPDHLQIISFHVFSLHFFICLEVWVIHDFPPAGNVFFACFYLEIHGFFKENGPKYHVQLIQLSIIQGCTAVKSCKKSCSQARGQWINKRWMGGNFLGSKKGGRCKKKLKPWYFQVVVLLFFWGEFFDDQFGEIDVCSRIFAQNLSGKDVRLVPPNILWGRASVELSWS